MNTFSEKVIAIVKKIPKGKTMSYKQVATKAGSPGACRAVGNILNRYYKFCRQNNLPTIPCHRVIRSDGKSGGFVLGEDEKKKLLIKEKQKI